MKRTAASLRADQAFRARVAELGGTVLEPTWLGAQAKHRIRCANGHESTPRPTHVVGGGGICRACSGRDPGEAERAFRARVAELGGTVLEPTWLGTNTPHRVRCAAGHLCTPRPLNVLRGHGPCRVCAGVDPTATERAFRARVAELGGTVLEPTWLGANKPHRVRCSAGHVNAPHPTTLQQGGGICRTCSGNDPREADRRFRARVAELGGTVLELTWLGRDTPHRVRCAAGHLATPAPSSVQQGNGICRICAGRAWDAFYVVADEARGRLKFGITSGDPRPRLADHRRAGYRTVLRLLVDLPGDTAPELERFVLATLRLAREEPVQGREHFADDVAALVLDVVDHFPIPRPRPAP